MGALPFAARLAAAIVGALVIGYILALGLAGIALRQALAAQDDATYRLLALELRRDVEGQLANGTPLARLRTAQMLARESLPEQDVRGLGVVTLDGVIASDTDAWRVNMRAPADWLPPSRGAREWARRAPTDALIGVVLAGPRANSVGYAVLRYDPRPVDGQVRALLLRLSRTGLVGLAAAGSLAIVAIYGLGRRHHRRLARVVEALEAAEGGSPQPLSSAAKAAWPTETRCFLAAVTTTVALLEEAGSGLLRIGVEEDGGAGGARV
jgi:hypothetical protein